MTYATIDLLNIINNALANNALADLDEERHSVTKDAYIAHEQANAPTDNTIRKRDLAQLKDLYTNKVNRVYEISALVERLAYLISAQEKDNQQIEMLETKIVTEDWERDN